MKALNKNWVFIDQKDIKFKLKSNKQDCFVFRQFNKFNKPLFKDILDELKLDLDREKMIEALWENPDFWIQRTIYLNDYTLKEKEWAAIHSGYKNIKDVQPAIIAERLFEHNIS